MHVHRTQARCVQGEDVFPIPGTKRVKYLEQNAAAFQIQLTAEDIKQLETVFATDQVKFSITHFSDRRMTVLFNVPDLASNAVSKRCA